MLSLKELFGLEDSLRIVVEAKENIQCPLCHSNLPRSEYFIKEGEVKPYWEGCKTCYKAYRRKLKEKKKSPIGPEDSKKINRILTKLASREEGKLWHVENEIEAELSFLAAKHLDNGLDRMVFEIAGNYVIKIDKSGRNQSDGEMDRGQNSKEVKHFKVIQKQSESIRECFLPILAYDKTDYLWIVMPKAETSNDGINCSEVVDRLRTKFAELGINMADLYSANVGMYKGRDVVIDYGYPIYFNKEED